jgi:hypothetical protein
MKAVCDLELQNHVSLSGLILVLNYMYFFGWNSWDLVVDFEYTPKSGGWGVPKQYCINLKEH